MDEKQEIEKKQKTWGSGGGMYRGVNVPVKILNYIIVSLMVILISVVIFLGINGHFTVTLETNGGESIRPIECKHGDSIEIDEPQRAGYTFTGWYLDQELKHKWDPYKQKVEQSMTLYASWKPNKINIIFDYDGGKGFLEHKEVIYNDSYGELPQPTKDGYQFLGWMYSNDFITSDTIVTVNGEHVLKALWQSQ